MRHQPGRPFHSQRVGGGGGAGMQHVTDAGSASQPLAPTDDGYAMPLQSDVSLQVPFLPLYVHEDEPHVSSGRPPA